MRQLLRFEEIEMLKNMQVLRMILKMNVMRDGMMRIVLCPTIFSLKENKFITELYGLLCRENVALYTVIEKYFLS